jgi:hypothetical protein
VAATSSPPPEAVRKRLLSILSAASSSAIPTTDLRRCLSQTFTYDFVHEQVYHNLLVLERRGEVTRTARTAASGRHTLWSLAASAASVDQ